MLPSRNHLPHMLINITIAVVAIQTAGMVLFLMGAPLSLGTLLKYYLAITVLMTYTSVRVLWRASVPGQFDIAVFIAFTGVFIVYNPFYLVFWQNTHIIIANLITIALLAWVAYWRPSLRQRPTARPV